jgi:hypothetical protein
MDFAGVTSIGCGAWMMRNAKNKSGLRESDLIGNRNADRV